MNNMPTSKLQSQGIYSFTSDSPIVGHLLQKLETSEENISFARVDADQLDKLISKVDTAPSKLSEEKTK